MTVGFKTFFSDYLDDVYVKYCDTAQIYSLKSAGKKVKLSNSIS